MSATKDIDGLIWGAREIARAAGLVDRHGKPRTRAAYHLLEKKLLPATKVGRTFVSTKRRLRAIANGDDTAVLSNPATG
jgi:hypothetical protein